MKQSGFSITQSRGRSLIACGLAVTLSLYSLPLSASAAFAAEGDAAQSPQNNEQVDPAPSAKNEQAPVADAAKAQEGSEDGSAAAGTEAPTPSSNGEKTAIPEGESAEQSAGQQSASSASEEPASVGESDEEAVDPAIVEEMYDGASDEEIAEVLSVLEPAEASEDDGAALLSLSGSGAVKTYGGATMFETAVQEAKAAYSVSDTVILAGPGEAWVDALAAAGLAGALDSPILFVQNDSLHPATKQALKDLKVKNAIVLGGTAAISDQVVSELNAAGVALKSRLGGANCYETQMKIYEYGLQNNLWNNDMAIVATGGHFGDALSVSPIAFAKKIPIFLADNGNLRTPQKNALSTASKSGKFSTTVIVGGEAAVSKGTKGFLDRMSTCTRLGGATQYETSTEIAKWAVKSQGFSWNNAAFTTGNEPYDALAGSVLQGKSKSVMLLVGDTSSATIKEASANQAAISNIRFFGGTAAIVPSLRTYIVSCLTNLITYEHTGVSLSKMASLEKQAASLVNPDQYSYEDDEFYQFAVLNEGYSGKVSAAQLNSFIATHGSDGKLAGMGQAFIDAAETYGTNEVYLLSHAILESGWGKSELAMGWKFDKDIKDEKTGKVLYKATGKTYYNFFGIGAYDSSPLSGGRLMAYKMDWDTPTKAILGAAKWIKEGSTFDGTLYGNYFNGGFNQITLYKMRWNYEQAAKSNVVWKQYATSTTWATGIANVMANCYASLGINKDGTGLRFLVPLYS